MGVTTGDFIASFLPASPPLGGALPLWIGFSTVLSVFNTVQCFISPKLNKRIYSKRPHEVSPLASRLFGMWTLLAAVLRLTTAYDVTSQPLYDMTLVSYVFAFSHFFSELFIFRTCSIGPGVLSPLVVASISTYWAYTQRDYYLGLL